MDSDELSEQVELEVMLEKMSAMISSITDELEDSDCTGGGEMVGDF